MRIFDSIPKGIERLRLIKQLSAAMKAREQEGSRLKKLSLLKQIREALTALGVTVGVAVVQAVARPVDTAIKFFPKEERRTPRARQKDNNAALALMDQIIAEGRPATEEEKAVLARFSGYGGNLKAPDGSTGSPYEYYTPAPIAAGIWDAMAELGFKGGKTLDPSAGSGVFAATRPRGVAMDQVELSNLSGQLNRLVNDDDTVSTKVSAFEYIAAATPDESYDAVVTNVPFGGNDVRDRRARESDKWSSESLEYYFILRSLDKLKPGGIAAFIVPPRVVSDLDAKSKELRHEASMRAEFIGAHRLPTDVFLKYSEADTIADVIFFRKHSNDARQKFREIAAEDITVLTTANVLWDEFVSGRYFNLSGKRFIHGEFKPKDPTKFRDVDRVINGPGLSDLRPLIAKLPKASRIDWDLIGAQQPVASVYRDGDVIYQDGRTLEMQGGEWVVRESDTYSFTSELAELTTPLSAVNKGTAWDAAGATIGRALERGQGENIPAWAMQAYRACEKVDPGARASVWQAACAALAVVDATARGTQQDYRAAHPELTKAVESGYSAMAKIPASAAKDLRDAVGKVKSHYSKRKGWSNFWKGDVLAEVEEKSLSPRAAYNKLRYESGDDQGFVAIDKITEIRGDDFDPFSDDDWCVSPDGAGIIHADEYYQGNYARWLAEEQANLDRATDPKVRAKIMRQIEAAKARLDVPSVDSMSFDLRSPFISIETKRAFLVETMTSYVSIEYEADTGKPFLKYTLDASKRGEREKVIARLFASYLKTGNINTGTATQSGGEAVKIDKKAEKEFLGQIKDMVASQNAAFNLWVKSNRVALDEVRDRFADPSTVEFVAVEDDAEIEIDGIHPDFKPHTYQRQEIRRQGRKFGGINGFGVGLGKAQPLDAKILTPTGWKLMGEIRVGDLVIAADGSAVPVTGVFPQGEKDIFECVFSDGSKARCCDDHLWFTETENDRAKSSYHQRKGRSVSYGSVKPLSEIRASLVVGKKQKNHKIPMVAPVQLECQDLVIDPYLFGVLLGDGCFSQRGVKFTPGDDEIADLVKAENGAITVKKTVHSDRAATYTVAVSGCQYGEAISRELSAIGLRGLLSHQKFIPAKYLHGSIDQRLMLLRGLMDTDGYVSKDGITVQFTSTSIDLADGVIELVQSLGGIAWKSSKIPTFRHNGEKRDGKAAYTVSMRMPTEINPFLLKRKADRVKPKTKYLPTRFFVEVNPVGRAEAQCISIDHPSRLYVTDGYIVTHNTSTALCAVQYAHSIGVKKKTMFVVPNTVLSNWRKEAIVGAGAKGEPGYRPPVLANADQCLFVGLDVDKKGNVKVSSGSYARDVTRIMENRHRMIFITLEAFKTIPLRESTVSDYQWYMGEVDKSFEAKSDKKADRIRAENKKEQLADSGEKSGAMPFFEDLGIDSIVMDEAHCFPAGTLVDGKPIELIQIGDMVRSLNHDTGLIEMRMVTDTMRRPVTDLVVVKFTDGNQLVCTPDHPIFTTASGYVVASEIDSSYDVVIDYGDGGIYGDLQDVRDSCGRGQAEACSDECGGVDLLLKGLLSKIESEEGSDHGELRGVRSGFRAEPHAKLEADNGEGDGLLVQQVMQGQVLQQTLGCSERGEIVGCGEGVSETEACKVQLAANAGSRGKESLHKDCEGGSQREGAEGDRRERSRLDGAAEGACRCAWVGNRGCCSDGHEGQRRSESLQGGHCKQGGQDCNRGGREIAPQPHCCGEGFEKVPVPRVTRVASVEVLQRGSDGEFGEVCRDGCVYDITVDGNHNFFAEGVLVHNCAKNSKFSGGFKGAAGLPLSEPSDRGLDAQVKSWLVRNGSTGGDGVMCLTATPITNSPLEIYAMLSLSVGEQEVNRRLGVRGAEEFLEAFCDIEHREEYDLIGNPREGRVFVGIKNTAMLSAAIRGIANIKEAADVGGAVELPDADEAKTRIDLGERDKAELMTLKRMYHIARQLDNGSMVNEDDVQWLAQQAAKFPGESVTLLAHPFNLINKMANLILDRELYEGLTIYKIQPSQREAAQKVVDRFNDSKISEDRERPGKYTKPENVTLKAKKVKLSDDDNVDDSRVIAVVKPWAWIEGDEIKIDTISYKTQDKFLAVAEKAKLLLDVNLSAKMAAFIENFKREQANPKASGKIAKQIVFADAMGSMHKIRLALVNHCGVPTSKIAVINGQAVTDPADMQEIQDGFNADADDNAYSVIIANKKAEVGINLQKGTQAIHHLTIGWTPDSLTQRNGRGVRQGNYLRRVTVYHYDAGGTFDEYKRGTVNKKGDWIGAVMAGGNESGVVRVSGQMTDEEAHELIMAVGDDKAVEAARAAAAKREHRQEIASARNQQVQTLRIIQSKLDWMSRNDGAGNFRATKEAQLKQLREAMQKAIDAYAKAQGTDKEERARVLMESAKARHAELSAIWGTEGSHEARMAEFNAAHEAAKASIAAAKAEFASLSKRKGAYSESTVNALEDKKAVIISGQVIENGMIAKVGDDYLIVRDESRRGRYGSFTPETYHPPSRRTMALKSIDTGVMFFGPGDADEDWGDAVRACVKIDEATVAASTEGFGVNDDSLYSTYIPAVRDALSVQIPSRNMAPDHVVLKAPYYATPIDPEIKFTAIGAAIVKEQSAITKWVTEKTYYRESRYVSISDLGLFGEGSRGDTAKNLIDWVIAHEYRLTAADAADLNDLPIGMYGRNDPMGTLITAYAGSAYDAGRADFDAMLSGVVAKAKVPSEIDAAVAAWFKQRLPLISSDLYDAYSLKITAPVFRQVAKLKDQLATGGKVVVWAESLIPDYGPVNMRGTIGPITEAVMADDEAMEAIADAMDAASISAIGRAPELHPALAAAFAAKIDGPAAPVEGAKEVSELVRRMLTPRIKEEAPHVLYQRDLVGHIANGIKAAGYVLSPALLELKAAKASGGIDVAGLVAKARSLPGVDRIEVSTIQIVRSKSPWSGAFVYEPGVTVSVATRYKSELSNQISSKESGLPGRYFDSKAKTWVFTLKDDAMDDKGAKVASLQDLIAFASKELGPAR